MMVTPSGCIDTAGVNTQSLGAYAGEYDEMFRQLLVAERNRDAIMFAQVATWSARVNMRVVDNTLAALLCSSYDTFGASGVVVGHTGTVVGLLFPIPVSDEVGRGLMSSRVRRAKAMLVRSGLIGDASVDVVMSPACVGMVR